MYHCWKVTQPIINCMLCQTVGALFWSCLHSVLMSLRWDLLVGTVPMSLACECVSCWLFGLLSQGLVGLEAGHCLCERVCPVLVCI